MKVTFLKPALGFCLSISLGLLFVSCENRESRASLSDIEGYIQDYPDSARTSLEGMDARFLNSKSLKADYALLYSAALDKTYADTTDLGVIRPAVEYYGRKRADADRGCGHEKT